MRDTEITVFNSGQLTYQMEMKKFWVVQQKASLSVDRLIPSATSGQQRISLFPWLNAYKWCHHYSYKYLDFF